MEVPVEMRAKLIQGIVDLAEGTYKALPQTLTSEWIELDATMPQLKILLLLHTDGALSVGSLASRLQIALPTVSGVLNRLERQGLTQRQRDKADRRLVICQLTGKGDDLAHRLWQFGRAQLAKLLETMTLEELQTVAGAAALLHTSAQALGTKEEVA